MWRVVKPSVGVPLFLGSVAVVALLVHAAVLFNTDWFPAFLNGGKPAATAVAPTTAPAVAAETPPVTPAAPAATTPPTP